MHIWSIMPLLIGGLSLFLYAITQLSSVMEKSFGESAKQTIAKYVSNLFTAIAIGAVFTILLGSSSAVIILVIVFINAGSITFRQAIGLIMGANIGTTFSSQLIALHVAEYAAVPLFIGLIIKIFSKNEKLKRGGAIAFYLGMLFFGLYVMEESVLPLRDSDVFLDWMASIDQRPVWGALIGGLVTLVIQSSSGTVGIAIVLGKQNIITAAAGISVMLGAELGTCSDTLLATINGKRQALKAGLFHLFFNLATITLGLIFFQSFVDLIIGLSPTTEIGGLIANAHMAFNILGVILFLPFVNITEKLLNRLLPEKGGG